MWPLLLLKVFKIGFKQAKKHHDKKKSPNGTSSTDDLTNPSSIDMTFQPPPTSPEPKPSKPFTHYCFMALHTLQLAFCLAVVGLYGRELSSTREDAAPARGKWVYAVIAGFLGAVTALGYICVLALGKTGKGIQGRRGLHLPLFVWEGVLVILLLVVFGLFGEMFIGKEDKGDKAVVRMRRAVWVVLVTLGLWVTSGVWAGLRWWRGVRVEGVARGFDQGEKV